MVYIKDCIIRLCNAHLKQPVGWVSGGDLAGGGSMYALDGGQIMMHCRP